MIRKENGMFVLYTEDGARVLGRHRSLLAAKAQKRLIQQKTRRKRKKDPRLY